AVWTKGTDPSWVGCDEAPGDGASPAPEVRFWDRTGPEASGDRGCPTGRVQHLGRHLLGCIQRHRTELAGPLADEDPGGTADCSEARETQALHGEHQLSSGAGAHVYRHHGEKRRPCVCPHLGYGDGA